METLYPSQDNPPSTFVQGWLKIDAIRWIAGILTGSLAASLGTLAGMLLADHWGLDFWFPPKLMATLFLGPTATEYHQTQAILVGFAFIKALGGFWGLVFAHFVQAKRFSSFLFMGWAWGLLGWIFNWNLFLQSFSTISSASISPAAGLLVFGLYGTCLVLFPWIDQILRILFLKKTPSLR